MEEVVPEGSERQGEVLQVTVNKCRHAGTGRTQIAGSLRGLSAGARGRRVGMGASLGRAMVA